MKNIHILPTDKPSNIYMTNKLYKYINGVKREPLNCTNLNIYITSDEEIKEGDWFISLNDDESFMEITKNDLEDFNNYADEDWTENCKKIILTTNQDLIKDGVQAIDDEFLEWFVKNPSCEFVKVLNWEGYSKIGLDEYEIIIPQEEPKCTCKEHDPYCCQVHGICPNCVKKEEPKQETLEEAAINCWAEGAWDNRDDFTDGFIEGAKWQAERMYSEAIEFAKWIRNNPYVWNYSDKLNDTRTTEELFEQFKKK